MDINWFDTPLTPDAQAQLAQMAQDVYGRYLDAHDGDHKGAADETYQVLIRHFPLAPDHLLHTTLDELRQAYEAFRQAGWTQEPDWDNVDRGETPQWQRYDSPVSWQMQHAEMMPIDEVRKFAEFDRTGTDRINDDAEMARLRDSIQREGIKHPLMLTWSTADNHAYMGEGHHRLEMAASLGHTHVPVTVIRNSGPVAGRGERLNRAQREVHVGPYVGPERDAWNEPRAPEMFPPSHIGLPGEPLPKPKTAMGFGTDVWYHCTRKELLPSITAQGLSARSEHGHATWPDLAQLPGVYLWANEERAFQYAEDTGNYDVVLRVHIPNSKAGLPEGKWDMDHEEVGMLWGSENNTPDTTDPFFQALQQVAPKGVPEGWYPKSDDDIKMLQALPPDIRADEAESGGHDNSWQGTVYYGTVPAEQIEVSYYDQPVDPFARPTPDPKWMPLTQYVAQMQVTAGKTRAQQLRDAEVLEAQHGPDQSRVVHTFPDGWTVRDLMTNGDGHREGALMGHCWAWSDADRAYWHKLNPDLSPEDWADNHDYITGYRLQGDAVTDPVHPRHHLSLRDPDNLPHLSWDHFPQSDGSHSFHDVFGKHNSPPKPEHWDRMRQYALTLPGRVDTYTERRPTDTDPDGYDSGDQQPAVLKHAMGLNGDLTGQVEVRFLGQAPGIDEEDDQPPITQPFTDHNGYDYQHPIHVSIYGAFLGAEKIGELAVDTEDNFVRWIEVAPAYRRMGVANVMADEVLRLTGKPIQHDEARSYTGEQWATKRKTEPVPERYPDEPFTQRDIDGPGGHIFGSVALPGGIVMQWATPPGAEVPHPLVRAFDGEPRPGEQIAELQLKRVGDRWVVDWVTTEETHRRQGIASALMQEMRKHYEVHHDERISPDGAAWAQKVGSNENWVYVNGSVAMGSGDHHSDLARRAAEQAGLDNNVQAYVSNMLARTQMPQGVDCAIGTFQGSYPSIWQSSIDRNHVWDAVMHARAQQAAARTAGMTRKKLLEYKDALIKQMGPDQHEHVMDFPDGWYIGRPTRAGDLGYAGCLMGNCTRDTSWNQEDADKPLPDDHFERDMYTLFDPQGLPHAMWNWSPGYRVEDAEGRHGSPLKDEYLPYIAAWGKANQVKGLFGVHGEDIFQDAKDAGGWKPVDMEQHDRRDDEYDKPDRDYLKDHEDSQRRQQAEIDRWKEIAREHYQEQHDLHNDGARFDHEGQQYVLHPQTNMTYIPAPAPQGKFYDQYPDGTQYLTERVQPEVMKAMAEQGILHPQMRTTLDNIATPASMAAGAFKLDMSNPFHKLWLDERNAESAAFFEGLSPQEREMDSKMREQGMSIDDRRTTIETLRVPR